MGKRVVESGPPEAASPASLGQFIVENMEAILGDWEEHARSMFPAADLSRKTLRDHAKQLLQAIAADISRPQSPGIQQARSKGLTPDNSPALRKAGEQHALARMSEQFDLEQIISEFRAVRGSVLQRWAAHKVGATAHPQEVSRFNEAIDEALAASARHYVHKHESIIRSSSDAIVGKTTAGIIDSWNPGATQIFGYTAAEAIGQFARILFAPGRLDEELEILARIAAGETVQSFDAVRMRKDGTHVHMSITVSPIHDGQGTIVGASMIARDISERKRMEDELRASEERFRAMTNAIPQLAWSARADGTVYWYNQRWFDYTGTTPELMRDVGLAPIHDPKMLPLVLVQWKKAIAAGELFEMEFPLRGADGVFRQFLTRAVPVKNTDGKVVQWAGTNTDVDELKRAAAALTANQALLAQSNEELKKVAAENVVIDEALKETASEKLLISEALYDEKERAQVTLNSIGDAVISTEINGNLSYLNEAAERLTQWTSAAALGRRLEEVFHIVDAHSREVLPNVMSLAVEQNIIVKLPPWCILIRPDGSELPIEDSCAPIHARDGKVTGAVMVFQDVSEARVLSQKLIHQAGHDSLTDLPNRTLLSDRLALGVAASHRHHTSLAVCFLDIDRFKHINDSLGHSIGDRLLQAIATRLKSCVRESDTVSRQGGDEFVVMLVDINNARDAAICAEKMLQALRLPYFIDSHELHVSGSIGIALCPQDGVQADALLRNADSAMYESKNQGRDNYQFYRKDLNESAHARQALEGDLRHAIDRQQLELHYQPIMDLGTGAISGVETLLRWKHPTQGLLTPADFMAIAEESGLIVPIGRWVLRTACMQARAWQLAGMAPLRHAVNVSAVELRSKGFVDGVAAIVGDTGIPPSLLELELTETFLMQESASSAQVFKSLKDIGVHLALDDFGTGYSSLSYMRRFPIDTLKIDRSFVKDLVLDAADASVVSAVISMGKSMHMQVVAEGVETREQLAFLEEQHCNEAQGFLFSPPVSAQRFASMIETGRTLYQAPAH
jgi:diguanylate cyclase (GGDEF)-like protein/PAS domain S-box-containing protein